MARFERSILIDAPPERVFALLCDVERTPKWWVNVDLIRQTSTGLIGVGATTESVARALGMCETVRGRFVEHDPPRRLGIESWGERGTRSWLECDLQLEEGGTRLRVIMEYRLPGGGIGKLLDRASEGQMRRDFDLSLRKLRDLLEH